MPTFDINVHNFLALKQKYNTTDLFVGEYYAIVEGKVCKVPIYTSPTTENGCDLSDRMAVDGFNFDTKINNVFRNYTYKKENRYKTEVREQIETLKRENNPADAEKIRRMERKVNAMRDCWFLHGSMSLAFYTK